MAVAAPAMMALTVASTAMSALSSIRQGQAANVSAKIRARQLEHQASQEEAAGQQAVEEKRRQSQILQSRALAIAGASGSSTLDSSVLNMIGGLAEEGEKDVQREKFATAENVNRARQGAAASRFEGRQALKAGRTGAISSAFSGLSSGISQYGKIGAAAAAKKPGFGQ